MSAHDPRRRARAQRSAPLGRGRGSGGGYGRGRDVVRVTRDDAPRAAFPSSRSVGPPPRAPRASGFRRSRLIFGRSGQRPAAGGIVRDWRSLQKTPVSRQVPRASHPGSHELRAPGQRRCRTGAPTTAQNRSSLDMSRSHYLPALPAPLPCVLSLLLLAGCGEAPTGPAAAGELRLVRLVEYPFGGRAVRQQGDYTYADGRLVRFDFGGYRPGPDGAAARPHLFLNPKVDGRPAPHGRGLDRPRGRVRSEEGAELRLARGLRPRGARERLSGQVRAVPPERLGAGRP